MKSVPRIGRILDLAGLVLFLGGAVFFAWAWAGFRDVPAFVPDPNGEPWAAVRLANGYLRVPGVRGGRPLAGGGPVVAAWWRAR